MKQERPGRMRLKASDKTSCLALRCGGASLGGDRRRRGQHPPPVPGAAGKGRAGQGRPPPPRVRGRGGGDERRAGTATRGPLPARARAARGTPATPPAAGAAATCEVPRSGKGASGVAGGGGEDPAPAAQLLARCLTSGRRKQLGGCSSEAGLVSSRCGMPANGIHLGQRAATVY